MFTREYKNHVPEQLFSDIQNIDWKNYYDIDDVNIAANIFTTCLKDIFYQHVSIKSKTHKEKTAAWLRADLKKQMDKRDQLLHKARKSKATTDWTAYKRARNQCNEKIREAKRKHYRNLMGENEKNPRKFWDTIKTIFPTNKKIFFTSYGEVKM